MLSKLSAIVRRLRRTDHYSYIPEAKADVPISSLKLLRKRELKTDLVHLGEHKIFGLNEKEIQIFGDARIGRDNQIQGDITVRGNLDIGENVIIEGNVRVKGNILVGRSSVIRGTLEAGGSLTMLEDTEARAAFANKDITLDKNALIRGEVASLNGVMTLDVARIEGNVVSGKDVILGSSSIVTGDVRAYGNVTIGADVKILSNLTSGGEVTLGHGTVVEKSLNAQKVTTVTTEN